MASSLVVCKSEKFIFGETFQERPHLASTTPR